METDEGEGTTWGMETEARSEVTGRDGATWGAGMEVAGPTHDMTEGVESGAGPGADMTEGGDMNTEPETMGKEGEREDVATRRGPRARQVSRRKRAEHGDRGVTDRRAGAAPSNDD